MIKYTILYFQTGPQFFTAAFLEYTDNNKIKLINWKYTGELNTSTLHRKEAGGGGGFERHFYRSISRTYIGNSEII